MTDDTKLLQSPPVPAVEPPPPLDLKTIDVASYCARIGQAVAQEMASLLNPGHEALGHEPSLWASFGVLRPYKDDDTGEWAVQDLARYVMSRKEPVSGDILYRKAHELSIHAGDPAGYAVQPLWLRLAYDGFAAAAWLSARSIEAEIAELDHAQAQETAAIEWRLEEAAIKVYLALRAIDRHEDGRFKMPEWDDAGTRRQETRDAVRRYVAEGFDKDFKVAEGKGSKKLNAAFRAAIDPVFADMPKL